MEGTQMEREPKRSSTSGGCWGRRSRRGRLLIIAIAVLIVVLGLGLGIGLGLGLRDDDGPMQTPKATETLPATPADAGIWQPPVGATWQIVLPKSIKLAPNATRVEPDVDIFDVDLFLTDKTTIDTLHRLGKKVICYFSAGSFEPDRPDSRDFADKDKGSDLAGWPGEKWLNLGSKNVRKILVDRLRRAQEKGCDGVDPDNVDAYANKNGLGMSELDSISFLRWLAVQAQRHKLAIGLKNSAKILPNVLPAVQFIVQEQCVQFSECSSYTPAINAGKPVFHIEYPSEVKSDVAQHFCHSTGPAAGAANFSTVIKRFNLDGWVQYCSGMNVTTPT